MDQLAPWEKPWARDFRGTNRARPTWADRSLASKPAALRTAPPARPPSGVPNPPLAGTARLSRQQSQQYRAAIARARGWLPKVSRQWHAFVEARQAGKPLPPKVARALTKHFNWADSDAQVPDMFGIIADLRPQLTADLPGTYHSAREESPTSAARERRWVIARPWFHDDGSARGLVLYPDFFAKTTDIRARSVTHEVLHTLERAGRWSWSDVAQEDQSKVVGSVQRYMSNPASYAGLLHDLGE
jgi:hypothetical protein